MRGPRRGVRQCDAPIPNAALRRSCSLSHRQRAGVREPRRGVRQCGNEPVPGHAPSAVARRRPPRDALETRCRTSPRPARVSKTFAVPGTVYCPLPAAQTQGGEPEIMYADFCASAHSTDRLSSTSIPDSTDFSDDSDRTGWTENTWYGAGSVIQPNVRVTHPVSAGMPRFRSPAPRLSPAPTWPRLPPAGHFPSEHAPGTDKSAGSSAGIAAPAGKPPPLQATTSSTIYVV